MTTIDAFDPAAANDDELRQLYDFEGVIEAETEPDDPRAPFEVAVREMREPPSWTKNLRWLARADGKIVGQSFLELEYLETNRYNAWVDVAVLPEHRRAHLACRLLEPAVEAAAADDRTVLNAWAAEESAGDAFLAALGLEKRSVERRSRLLTHELDRSMLEEWVERAAERAAGYSLIGFDDHCPDEWVEPYVTLFDVMNTAPRDDLDMEDWHHTPERIREHERRREWARRHKWSIIARHDATGALAGFTEVIGAEWETDLIWQEDTGVDPAHREKGLGRWLKAAMLLRLLDERPEVRRIDTWNAGSNRPMLAINVALGFRPVKHYGDWQISTDKLRDAVARRV